MAANQKQHSNVHDIELAKISRLLDESRNKDKNKYSPAKAYNVLTIIWPRHHLQHVDWAYISRRLYDMHVFLYWVEAPESLQSDVVFLANLAMTRELLGHD